MSDIPITIGDTLIEFPGSSSSPNWAPALIAFAQAVAAQFALISPNPGDVPPTVIQYNTNNLTHQNILGLLFATASVRSAEIRYAVYRQTTVVNPGDTTTVEAGIITISYNPNNVSVGGYGKWDISQISDDPGNSGVTFFCQDTGQMDFSSITQAGSNYVMYLSFAAQALAQVPS